MAWVRTAYGRDLFIEPHQTDMDCFRIVKSRQPTNCANCGRKIPSKSYIYGGNWIRICLSCGEKFSKEAIKKFEEIIETIKTNQDILKENKEKWEANNMLVNL